MRKHIGLVLFSLLNIVTETNADNQDSIEFELNYGSIDTIDISSFDNLNKTQSNDQKLIQKDPSFFSTDNVKINHKEPIINQKYNETLNQSILTDQNVQSIPDSSNVIVKNISFDEFTSLNRFDRVAKQLSGEYYPENNSIRKTYAEFMHSSWNKLYKNSISNVPKWTQENIQPLIQEVDTLFYPFGGPDVSYSTNFFPNVKRYILVGLEPLGNFNQIENMIDNDSFFTSVKKAFSSFLDKGYFITSEMLYQLSNSSVKGGLNMILLALPKLGFTIVSVENCSINSEGSITEPNQDNIRCVKIVCRKTETNDPKYNKEIYYIRANLDNVNTKMDYLLKFVGKYEFTTFIKSASYALHDAHFTKLRSFILDNTHSILQDDTGIPFNFFRQHENWDIHIFGTYVKPTLPVFHAYKQESLTQYYLNHKAKPISFPIGYGYNKRTPNLIFTVSKRHKLEKQLNELKNELKKKKCDCIFQKKQ